jgi:hypothetical protein
VQIGLLISSCTVKKVNEFSRNYSRARENLLNDIPAGDEKLGNLFLTVYSLYAKILRLGAHIIAMSLVIIYMYFICG